MKTIFQADEYGCGIACLAMLAGLTYEKAKVVIGNNFYPDYGVDTAPMIAALSMYGIRQIQKGRLSQSKTVDDLKNNALLHCKLLPTRGLIDPKVNTFSHWVVWDAEQEVVRDPYRYKKPIWLTSFIELEKIA